MINDDLKLEVITGTPLLNGVPIVCGIISAILLLENYKIPYRSTSNSSGYQRHPQEARINRLASDIGKGRVDLPTSVLMNIRNVQPQSCLEKVGGKTYLLITEEPFYIVDGQHRILALEKARKTHGTNLANRCLNMICMIGANELQEMEQFYIVNSTAKAVRTDLAMDLLRQQAVSNSHIMDGVLERGEKWKIDAQGITQTINTQASIWRDRIRLPNEPKSTTVIPSSSFVTSLKKVMTHPFFEAMSINDCVSVIEAYWEGIRRACPEPFMNPQKYSLQKGIGVNIMHSLLVDVVERIRSKGLDLKDPESYITLMHNVLNGIEGDSPKTGEKLNGADFWLTVPDGAAGTFSSSAGKRLLLNKAKDLLPPIQI